MLTKTQIRANLVHHEWIIDLSGNVCFRAMQFDRQGNRVFTHWPKKDEFIPYSEAERKLQQLEIDSQVNARMVHTLIMGQTGAGKTSGPAGTLPGALPNIQ